MASEAAPDRNVFREILPHVVLFLLVVALDQGSKILATRYLEAPNQVIDLFPPDLALSYLRNPISGVHSLAVYLLLNFLLFPILFWQYSLDRETPPFLRYGITLVWAGVFANNFLDAFWLGYIRDFIYLSGFGTGNLADQAKYLGCIFAILGDLQSRDWLPTPGRTLATLAVVVVLFLLLMKNFYGVIKI